MHQKKSQPQIREESSGVSSGFNPSPPLQLLSSSTSSLHQKHPQFSNNFTSAPQPFQPFSSAPPPPPSPQNECNSIQILIDKNDPVAPSRSSSSGAAAAAPGGPQRRPLLGGGGNSGGVDHGQSHEISMKTPSLGEYTTYSSTPFSRVGDPNRVLTHFQVIHQLRHLRRLIRHHLRLFLLLSLPFFYFLVSHPTQSFILDFLFAFAFSAALLFSLNLALPRLPSIRLFLARSLPSKFISSSQVSNPHLPVFWSIGSTRKHEKGANSGCWVQEYRNGDVYEGEFHKGKCSGSGVYYYFMSGRYEGDWVDGKYDGYGVETWARGSRYRGQYRQGLRHGYGVYRFYTGDVYFGEWSNGQSHGIGVHTCEDGSRYVGEFKWGVKHGLGYYHFRNGDKYAGEYFADKMHGFGVYQFANGHRYEGAWHEGKRQGLGMYTFRNGETQSGHWKNGVLDVPSTQSTSFSTSPLAVYHSKVLHAIQEARRASNKAYDGAKVDERVNRAVATANKAANAARVAAVKAMQKRMHRRSDSDEIPYPVVGDAVQMAAS